MNWKARMLYPEPPTKKEEVECTGCEEPITGSFSVVNGRPYHRIECFLNPKPGGKEEKRRAEK